jgi:hypothetical protein
MRKKMQGAKVRSSIEAVAETQSGFPIHHIDERQDDDDTAEKTLRKPSCNAPQLHHRELG